MSGQYRAHPRQASSQVDFALSQPYQISDHLNSMKTLERGLGAVDS